MNSEKLYQLVRDTLNMLPTNIGDLTDEDIIEYLEELEGDYHSFFHLNVLDELLSKQKIDKESYKSILKLNKLISEIKPNLWKVSEYKNNKDWILVRNIATTILEKIK